MRIIVLIIWSILTIESSNAQCIGFPPTFADTDCGSGIPLASLNASINAGSTHFFCGTNSTTTSFNAVNLNGGTLTICGNASLSGNWNSGVIIIGCGVTVDFPNGLTMNNNVRIINYGRVNVTGTLNFQNANNCFYNESIHSKLVVTNSILFNSNSSNTGYLKNNGYISVGSDLNVLEGGAICTSDGSIIETVNLTYNNACSGTANRITFSSSTGQAIIKHTGLATLRGGFTNSSNIKINKGAGSSQHLSCGSSSWGNAVVAFNSPAFSVPTDPVSCPYSNCYTLLPIELSYFDAKLTKQKTVDLSWKTQSEQHNDYFTIERSTDGFNWEFLGKVDGSGTTTIEHNYSLTDLEPLLGGNYYALSQTDFNGNKRNYEINFVELKPDGYIIVPNPSNGMFSIYGLETKEFKIEVVNSVGKVVFLSENQEFVDLSGVSNGVYFVQISEKDDVQNIKIELQK